MEEWDFLRKSVFRDDPGKFWFFDERSAKPFRPMKPRTGFHNRGDQFKFIGKRNHIPEELSIPDSLLTISPDLDEPTTQKSDSVGDANAAPSTISSKIMSSPKEDLKIPVGNVFEFFKMRLLVGSKFKFRPSAISYEDLSFGCYLATPGTEWVSVVLEKLGKSMLVWYRPKRETMPFIRAGEIVPGFLVAVAFPGSVGYHRGVIAGHTQTKIKVQMLDFGVFVYCRQEDLFPLHTEFTEMVPLAITCRIVDLKRKRRTHAKLKLFLDEAVANDRLEVIIYGISKPEFSLLKSCICLDVGILVDREFDLVDVLPKYHPTEREPRPIDNLVPEYEQHRIVLDNHVVDFNGYNYEEFYADLMEAFTTP